MRLTGDHSSQESWLSRTLACPAETPGSHVEQLRAAPAAEVGSSRCFLEPIDAPPTTAIPFQALETVMQCLRNAIKGLSGGFSVIRALLSRAPGHQRRGIVPTARSASPQRICPLLSAV